MRLVATFPLLTASVSLGLVGPWNLGKVWTQITNPFGASATMLSRVTCPSNLRVSVNVRLLCTVAYGAGAPSSDDLMAIV